MPAVDYRLRPQAYHDPLHVGIGVIRCADEFGRKEFVGKVDLSELLSALRVFVGMVFWRQLEVGLPNSRLVLKRKLVKSVKFSVPIGQLLMKRRRKKSHTFQLSSVVLRPSLSQACSIDMLVGFLLISSCHAAKQDRKKFT